MSVHLATLILHVLAACVVVGIVFFSLVFSTANPLDEFRLKTIKAIRKFGIYSMGLVTITGIMLVQQEKDVLDNRWFWVKLILIVVDYFVAVKLIGIKVNATLQGQDAEKSGRDLRRLTWISALIFLVIITISVSLVEHS